MKQLKRVNLETFVDLLGGNAAAAERFDTSYNTICNWKGENRLPGWAVVIALELARELKVELAPGTLKVRRPTGARPLAAAE